MTTAPDGRVFVTEKDGRVRIIEENVLLADPFVTLDVDDDNERGLQGIALDPDFEMNGYVYVYYTVSGKNHNRVSRFTSNGNYAVPGSERILLELDPLSWLIHNGGALAFGKDGKLYIATGDGASPQSAQSLNSLHGKVLRINVDGSIPEDNPFVEQTTGKYKSIWALGFRNPFTFEFDSDSGSLFLNDVGGEDYEEVNVVEAGMNYGWPLVEGVQTTQSAPANYKDPLYAYNHQIGCAIVGAAFYKPLKPTFPSKYVGKYFFADYCNSKINILDPATGEVLETFASGIIRPLSIKITGNGDLYYLEREMPSGTGMDDNTSSKQGKLWKVVYTGSGAPVVASQPANTLAVVGEGASFHVIASGTAPYTYSWYKNGIAIPGATQASFLFEDAQLSDNDSRFTCRITNSFGSVVSQEAILTVTANSRPEPAITSPAINSFYKAGDVIHYEGTAFDAEDGEIAPASLSWWINFHHDLHTHPVMSSTSDITSGSFEVPRSGETSDNVWYRIHLQATDNSGLSKTTYRDVLPIKGEIKASTSPEGLQLNFDGQYKISPIAVIGVAGIIRTLEAPLKQVKDGHTYVFKQWSDGTSQRIVNVNTIEGTYEIIAQYEELPYGEGTGLAAEYFVNDKYFRTLPVLARVDPIVDFEWSMGAPDPQLQVDNFSARWSGKLMPYRSGTYTFYVASDDGVRLWIDDELLIDQWVLARDEYAATIELTAFKAYDIRLEYFEASLGAMVSLSWSGEGLEKQVIPQAQLYPDATLAVPNVEIDTPVSEARYMIGEVLAFSGSGSSADNLPVPASDMSWWIDYHDNGKISRRMDVTYGLNAGTFLVPLEETTGSLDNVWYRIYLKAVDETGLSKITYRDVLAMKGKIRANTSPEGLQLNIDGQDKVGPITATSVAGLTRQIEAPLKQLFEDKEYFFQEWSDGTLEPVITITTGETVLSITAIYIAKEEVLGIEHEKQNAPLNIYPVPVHNKLYIDLSGVNEKYMTLHIYSALGKMHINRRISSGDLIDGLLELDVSSLMNGLYMIKISGERFSGIRKFIKD
ncbi:hypothetical protein GCM10027443_01250 [Pontibacter brevis]